MADDRIFIKCKGCGGWKMILKHYISIGPTHRDNRILAWLDSHASCHPHQHSIDLRGNPGFTLHTEADLKEDGCLDWSKQNSAPTQRKMTWHIGTRRECVECGKLFLGVKKGTDYDDYCSPGCYSNRKYLKRGGK